MQMDKTFNKQNRKLRIQAMGLTFISIFWVAGMLGILLHALSDHEKVDLFRDSLTEVNMSIGALYESAVYDVETLGSIMDTDEGTDKEVESYLAYVDKFAELRQDIHISLENSNNVLKDTAVPHSMATHIETLRKTADIVDVKILGLDSEDESVDIVQVFSVLKEIRTINMGLISDLSAYQHAQTVKLYREMIFGTICVAALFAISNLWLMIAKTLNPISQIKRALEKSKTDYQIESVEIEDNNEIGDLVTSYNQMRLRAQMIESLIEKLYGHTHFEQILDFVFEQFQSFLPYNRIGIAILSSDRKKIRALSARSDRAVSLKKNYEAILESTSLEEIIESGEPRIINDLEAYYLENPDSDSTHLMLKEGMYSSVTLPLNVRENCVGVVFFSSELKKAYTSEHTGFLKTIALSLAAAFDQSFLSDQLVVSTIEGFSKLVESKDSDTGNHIERMQRYSVMLAEMTAAKGYYADQIDEAFIKQIEDFSPLHDIGKVSIPDYVLMKPGKLTTEEFELMKEHTHVGADILRKMNDRIEGENRAFYKVGIEIVRHHHEKFDGTGYPDGLSGHAIPLSARIVAVADVLDAITSKRPYKNAFGMETSRRIMVEGRGKHFDPLLIDVLLENWDRFEHQIDAFKSVRAVSGYALSS